MSVFFWHGSFIAEWRDEYGKKCKKAFPIQPDAKRFEQKMRREVKQRRNAMKRDPAAAVGKVGELCDIWAESQKYWYGKRVARDVKVKLGSLRLHELQPFHASMMRDFWKQWGLADNTRSNFEHTFKRLLRYFEMLPGAPRECSKFLQRIKPYKPRKEFLSVTEERLLLDHPVLAEKKWLRCWLEIYLCLGLRNAEVRSLAPHHYDPETKMVKNVRSKGEVDRWIAVPTELQQILEPIYQKHGPVETPFIEILKGAPVNFSTVRWHFNDLKKKAGVPQHKRPHDLRATAITTYHLNNGKDLLATQRFAGHKYSGSTEAYVRCYNDMDMAPSIEKARVLRMQSIQTARIVAVKKTG